jgi:hypothetical protein
MSKNTRSRRSSSKVDSSSRDLPDVKEEPQPGPSRSKRSKRRGSKGKEREESAATRDTTDATLPPDVESERETTDKDEVGGDGGGGESGSEEDRLERTRFEELDLNETRRMLTGMIEECEG